jgi:DNA-directed RNA polymerase specialized sigma24 family protein
VSTDLIGRALAGDERAFGDLVAPYRRELQAHCYRVLGSVADAEDALQETLLAAWQGLAGFEGRSSVRVWLYQIATRRCLNALRAASRRPPLAWPPPGVVLPEPTRAGEVTWLEPYPDVLLRGARRRRARPRGPLRGQRGDLGGLRHGPAAAAAAAARRADLAGRPRVPG